MPLPTSPSDTPAAAPGAGEARPVPRHVGPGIVAEALRRGLRLFFATARLSLAYAAVFALIGTGLLAAAVQLGLPPLAWVLAGGFLLVAPALLAGFFAISAAHAAGHRPRWRDIAAGYTGAPKALFGLALVCAFLFLIWLTDAGILYSFMVGERLSGWRLLLPLSDTLLRFHAGATVMGAVFALIVYCITAYAVPLLIERRASLVVAVASSVRAVFVSPLANLAWGLVLAVAVLVSAMLPPLLAPILPVMAYASEAMYRAVFPAAPGASPP